MSFSTSIDRRDFFAAAALVGLLSSDQARAAAVIAAESACKHGEPFNPGDILASQALQVANALLEQTWRNPVTKQN
jgi:hypothetical protein